MVAELPGKPVTRFAPSPTGYLHLGHVAHMLYVWGVAGLVRGGVLLRIEDHDRQRCRPEYEAALLEDMQWLGFRPANTLSPEGSDYRQSDCGSAYEAMLRNLSREHHVYRCRCSRKDLAGDAPPGHDGERAYSGRCRTAGHAATQPHGIRIAWDPSAAPESFHDALLGAQCQRPERQCGDLLLRDRVGNWTYQFAVTADDFRHGVNLVVRGSDLLGSTGRQIRLARMMGRANRPVFVHHPLVRSAGGEKLSKRRRPEAVRVLREAGMAPQTVLGLAARAIGLAATAREIAAVDAAQLVSRRHPGILRSL